MCTAQWPGSPLAMLSSAKEENSVNVGYEVTFHFFAFCSFSCFLFLVIGILTWLECVTEQFLYDTVLHTSLFGILHTAPLLCFTVCI